VLWSFGSNSTLEQNPAPATGGRVPNSHSSTFVHQRKLYIMKTIIKKEKTFDTVKVFREIKEKIAKETEKMTFVEFKEYLNKNKLQTDK
jgi:hypothetical protein